MKNIQNYIEKFLDKSWIPATGIVYRNEIIVLLILCFFAIAMQLVKWRINKNKLEQEFSQTNRLLELLLKNKKQKKSIEVGNIKIEYHDEIKPKENSP